MGYPEACPDDATIAAFVRGEPLGERAVEIERHLSRCPACRQMLSSGGPATPTRQAPIDQLAIPYAGRMLAHFKIERQIGRGGMGLVYLAKDTRLRRKVALKVLPLNVSADDVQRRRCLREARAASAVVHPNVATVFDVGEAEGIIFIAMEYVEGPTVRDLLVNARGPLEVHEAVRITSEVCRGLAKAHSVGVVHRDLKPDNVIVSTDGTVKILDFGLAKRTHADRETGYGTETGVTTEWAIGTPSYMSPEQIRAVPVDARSDIFSLGVALYEMVTGALPFTGSVIVEVFIAIDRHEPPLPSAINPSLSPAIDHVVYRCLRKDPAERFQSADELREALFAAIAEPVVEASAPPPPPPSAPPPSMRPQPGQVQDTDPPTGLLLTIGFLMVFILVAAAILIVPRVMRSKAALPFQGIPATSQSAR